MRVAIEGPQLTEVNLHQILYIQTTKSHIIWGGGGGGGGEGIPGHPLSQYETLIAEAKITPENRGQRTAKN